jgi:hypothetical protein
MKMQAKYLAALKTRYASFGLSKEALDRVASQRFKTIANEDEIDGDILSGDTMLLIMKEMQGSADVLRASNAKIQKELDDFKKPTTPTPAPVAENPYKEQFEEMQRMHKEMMDKFAENERKARNESILASVHTKMKAMGCANEYIRTTTLAGITIGDNDTADSLAERYKPAYDANCKAAFGDGYIPPKGGVNGGDEIDFSAMVAGLQASGDLPK